MDAFYASVEQRDNPALIGKPVIVGAPPTQRGVVCAASYKARKFGIRSAMASITVKRLCPDGCFVRPRMDAYREESDRIMEIIASTGATVEQMSVDEAYLDVTSVCQAEDADASLRMAVPLARELKAHARPKILRPAPEGTDVCERQSQGSRTRCPDGLAWTVSAVTPNASGRRNWSWSRMTRGKIFRCSIATVTGGHRCAQYFWWKRRQRCR